MAKIVGMNLIHLPEIESESTEICNITSQYVSENPGKFRCSDSENQLFNVAEFDIMLNYIYDLQDRGYTKYVEGFGSQEWIDEIGPYYPRPTPPEPTTDVTFHIRVGCRIEAGEDPNQVFMEMANVASQMAEPCWIPMNEIVYDETGCECDGQCGPNTWPIIEQMAQDWQFSYETTVTRIG